MFRWLVTRTRAKEPILFRSITIFPATTQLLFGFANAGCDSDKFSKGCTEIFMLHMLCVACVETKTGRSVRRRLHPVKWSFVRCLVHYDIIGRGKYVGSGGNNGINSCQARRRRSYFAPT